MIYYKKSNVKEDFYGKRKKQRNGYAERSPCRKIIMFALPILLILITNCSIDKADR